MKSVKITLSQITRSDDATDRKSFTFRIAKLIGAIEVHTQSKPNAEYHVGDIIDENVARDLSIGRNYEVTIYPADQR
jgi:hypothetical protein